MDEEAKQALSEIIQKAADGIDGAVLFTQEHLPDVVHQLLVWHSVKSGIGFFLGILILIATACFLVRVYRTMRSDDAVLVTLFSFLPAGLGFVCVVTSLGWLQILIAPKLYLLEYAANLV